jgi:hypothetical protein
LITETPTWRDNDNPSVEYDCYHITNNTIALLLKISWPEVSNIDDMDLDFYQLSIEILDGKEKSLIDNCTIKTDATSYKYIFEVPETSNNLMARVQINAVNRCNDISDMQLSNNYSDIDKGMLISITMSYLI